MSSVHILMCTIFVAVRSCVFWFRQKKTLFCASRQRLCINKLCTRWWGGGGGGVVSSYSDVFGEDAFDPCVIHARMNQASHRSSTRCIGALARGNTHTHTSVPRDVTRQPFARGGVKAEQTREPSEITAPLLRWDGLPKARIFFVGWDGFPEARVFFP